MIDFLFLKVATVQASTANNRKVVYELAEAYVGIESDEGSPDGNKRNIKPINQKFIVFLFFHRG